MSYEFPQQLKNTAFKAAHAASYITLKYFRNLKHVASKGDNQHWDPVTIADKEAEQEIRHIITQDFPNHGIIGEEYTEKTAQSDYSWIIDPIDGTRGFVSGLPNWGTLIGVLYQNKPIFGLMAQPVVGDIFYGDCHNSFLLHNDQEQKLATSQIDDPKQARLFCTTPEMFTTKSLKGQFQSLKQQCLTVRYGTDCYGYAALAAGWGDIVFEADIHTYDVYPMIPIIQGAGGVISAPDGSYFKSGSVIASANHTLHKQLINYLA